MREALERFYQESRFNTKGPLSVALQLSRAFQGAEVPINPNDFLADRGGQVKGLGGPNLKKILLGYGIDRPLSSEGGRTSRGSIDNMRAYVEFLNDYGSFAPIDWDEVEQFWIGKIQDYFDATPFTLSLDASQSIKTIIRDVTEQAVKRQRLVTGVKYLGTIMQHLVGAKLDMVMGAGTITHNSSSNNDQEHGRTGDFDIGDVSIHVTTRPSEALLIKCRENLAANRKPLIVTIDNGVGLASDLANELGIEERVEVIDFIQFIVANIHERGLFDRTGRHSRIEELIERYNSIIDRFETDPSLKIEVAAGR
ncbi:DUF4928 family protein [Hymenobacter sp. BRD67]|uniref:DUF4928 family protein n=1 Tax=Hymenobacter sp. BRD67 TaxID=2675877 RepID=UPI0015645600|nr:DUF4928 family protein [Hymenobacter sp. BRD67]QKG52255.1 DUF4928 family protein [Hymenobacter sp. BRD67]